MDIFFVQQSFRPACCPTRKHPADRHPLPDPLPFPILSAQAPQSLRRSPPRELPNFSVSEGLVSHPPRDRQRDPSSSAACDLLVRAPSATLSLSAVRCDTVVPFATAASAATSVVAAASGQRAPPSARGRASSAARDLLVSAVCRESAVRDSCLSRNERRRDSVGAGNSVRARTSLERRPRPPREPCPRAPSSSCRPHDPHRRAPSAARAPSARRRPREPRPRALSATAVISAERCPRAVRDSCLARNERRHDNFGTVATSVRARTGLERRM